MSYKRCFKYANTVKICSETIASCASCRNKRHKKDKYISTEVRFCHCGPDHQASQGTVQYSKEKQKSSKSKQKNAYPYKLQVVRKLLTLNPNPEVIFSNAVKNTSNLTSSKFPTISAQEWSGSSVFGFYLCCFLHIREVVIFP